MYRPVTPIVFNARGAYCVYDDSENSRDRYKMLAITSAMSLYPAYGLVCALKSCAWLKSGLWLLPVLPTMFINYRNWWIHKAVIHKIDLNQCGTEVRVRFVTGQSQTIKIEDMRRSKRAELILEENAWNLEELMPIEAN